jgi:hypothetical protein
LHHKSIDLLLILFHNISTDKASAKHQNVGLGEIRLCYLIVYSIEASYCQLKTAIPIRRKEAVDIKFVNESHLGQGARSLFPDISLWAPY